MGEGNREVPSQSKVGGTSRTLTINRFKNVILNDSAYRKIR